MTDSSDDNEFEMVSGRPPLRVEISGVEDEDLAKLLQDTAQFIRSKAQGLVNEQEEDEDLEIIFKRVDLGDFVIVSVRS
ncbi:hypothetical protein [Sphingomonas pituitosa]|uniref:hypothetical protein n=1 Tax=Sphingomonas pituitosa TaxID=99597 RepID=UPI0008325C63|nr:hypothetical protein [Sphingomonas pituitosa]